MQQPYCYRLPSASDPNQLGSRRAIAFVPLGQAAPCNRMSPANRPLGASSNRCLLSFAQL
ncbi:MAG: hypothetical protein KME45_24710 [Stenomitos rutilans HA7619-LM2]|nr:hypothetical protein [Stenomitos rutilans HA7619-LM2]